MMWSFCITPTILTLINGVLDYNQIARAHHNETDETYHYKRYMIDYLFMLIM